jgi:hypothetical protein
MNGDTYHKILDLLRRLDAAKIAHRLTQCRDDAIMIEVDVPGERWEIEFVDYGDAVHVEIERFRSNGKMYGEAMLETLFAKYAEDSPAPTAEQVRQDSEDFFHALTDGSSPRSSTGKMVEHNDATARK